jgi:hypothetical protein
MTLNDVLISGTPRSGTTLTCHLLNKVDDTVALHEPMRGKEWAGMTHDEVADRVAEFCAEQRHSLHESGEAISKNVRGEVPDNPSKAEQGPRKSKDTRSKIKVDKTLSQDFTLVLKHNAGFTAVLDGLVKEFRVYAVLRNPLAVVSSWNTNFGANRGRIPAAERVDPELREALDSLPDPLDRQLHILNWFYERCQRFIPEENFIRYEDVVATGGSVLEKISPRAGSLSVPLESRNSSGRYDSEMEGRIGRKLLESDGAYWRLYSHESVEEVMNTRLAQSL